MVVFGKRAGKRTLKLFLYWVKCNLHTTVQSNPSDLRARLKVLKPRQLRPRLPACSSNVVDIQQPPLLG
jgi:hypothetical protein